MNISSIIPVLDAASFWVWETSLHAAVLIALVWAAQWTGRSWLTPRMRYALSLLVLIRLLLPFAPASPFSIFNLGKSFNQATKPQTNSETALPATVILAAPPPSERIAPRIAAKLPAAPHDLLHLFKWLWLGFAFASLALVLARQQSFARRVRKFPAINEPRTLALLESCRVIMRLKQRVKLVAAADLNTPAVFGFWNPHLLLPEDIGGRLTEAELRLVFLHELAHIKRGDILLNWVMILASSLHWFNPLVWLTLKRLRADRELVCDAMVMDRLSGEERRVYGHTLIKLADDFSVSGFCPSLAPVIHNKQETKRRIIMITKYKPTTRIALAALALLVILLGCFTFTRAAEKPKEPAKAIPPEATAPNPDRQVEDTKQQSESRQRGIKRLEAELFHENNLIEDLQEHVNRLRQELKIPTQIAESESVSTLDPETIRKLENIKIDSESIYTRLTMLSEKLQSLPRSELLHVLPTANPDTLLINLLEEKLKNERALASFKIELTPEHVEMKQALALQSKITEQINQRMDGVLAGIRAMAAAARAQFELSEKQIEAAKKNDLEAQMIFQPYFETKRRLETQKRMREAIAMRLSQEKIDAALRFRSSEQDETSAK